jgi:catechol 2,3-dioxygenase-like lactoylglutathione lyase family enzyme
MLRIDHVAYAVRDLDVAAQRFYDEFGFSAVEKAVHPEWGTGNRIIPLGSHFIELVGIVDPKAAAHHFVGQWLSAFTASGDRLAALCLNVDHIEEVTSRLGLQATPGFRAYSGGQKVTWHSAGMEAFAAEGLPYFFAWDDQKYRLGPTRPQHRIEPRGIAWVEMGGNPERIHEWIGGADLPLRVIDGKPGLHTVGIETVNGEVVLR